MLVVQVWLVATGSLLVLLLLVMGVQAVWGLLRPGRGAVVPDVATTEPVGVELVGSAAA